MRILIATVASFWLMGVTTSTAAAEFEPVDIEMVRIDRVNVTGTSSCVERNFEDPITLSEEDPRASFDVNCAELTIELQANEVLVEAVPPLTGLRLSIGIGVALNAPNSGTVVPIHFESEGLWNLGGTPVAGMEGGTYVKGNFPTPFTVMVLGGDKIISPADVTANGQVSISARNSFVKRNVSTAVAIRALTVPRESLPEDVVGELRDDIEELRARVDQVESLPGLRQRLQKR